MTQIFHQQIHVNPNTIPSGIGRAAFDKWKAQYWQQREAVVEVLDAVGKPKAIDTSKMLIGANLSGAQP